MITGRVVKGIDPPNQNFDRINKIYRI